MPFGNLRKIDSGGGNKRTEAVISKTCYGVVLWKWLKHTHSFDLVLFFSLHHGVSFFKVDVYNFCTLGRPAPHWGFLALIDHPNISHVTFHFGERERETQSQRQRSKHFFFCFFSHFHASPFPFLSFSPLSLSTVLFDWWFLRQEWYNADSKKSGSYFCFSKKMLHFYFLFLYIIIMHWAALHFMMNVDAEFGQLNLLANHLGYTSVILGSQIWPTQMRNCLRSKSLIYLLSVTFHAQISWL